MVTKPVSVFGHGYVFQTVKRKTIDDTGVVTDKRQPGFKIGYGYVNATRIGFRLR